MSGGEANLLLDKLLPCLLSHSCHNPTYVEKYLRTADVKECQNCAVGKQIFLVEPFHTMVIGIQILEKSGRLTSLCCLKKHKSYVFLYRPVIWGYQ